MIIEKLKQLRVLLKLIIELNQRMASLEERLLAVEQRSTWIQTGPISTTWFKPVPTLYPNITAQPIGCPMGGDCDYPNPWHATVPAWCKKCGKPAQSGITITCAADTTGQTS